MFLRFTFRDEDGKYSIARYKLVGIVESHIKDFVNYIWKLDARSIRYMKRKKIIENIKSYRMVI